MKNYVKNVINYNFNINNKMSKVDSYVGSFGSSIQQNIYFGILK